MQPHQEAVPCAVRDSVLPQALVRVWVKLPHLPAGAGPQAVVVPQHLVPLALRLDVVQFSRVRVWLKLFPEQMAPGEGCHPVDVHVLGQDLVPVALRLAWEQSLS